MDQPEHAIASFHILFWVWDHAIFCRGYFAEALVHTCAIHIPEAPGLVDDVRALFGTCATAAMSSPASGWDDPLCEGIPNGATVEGRGRTRRTALLCQATPRPDENACGEL